MIVVAKNESLSLFAAPRMPAPCPSLRGLSQRHSSYFGRTIVTFWTHADPALIGGTLLGLRARWDWDPMLFSNLIMILPARDYF